MAKSDGSVIIDTLLDTKGFGKGVTNMKSQFSSMSGAAKKMGVAIGAAFAVTALVNFGKQAVELGSNLQEVQNVVDVTFTTMSEKVNEFARDAAASAGLSETMAKKYVGTFGAMSKSFGFAEQEAFDMSTSLTQLAGDVASFYNLTQDEAYTKFKSVFTGETETLKDLGVVMTQTALDSFAMAKGYGKTTDAMSEQEKVALRYRFVMEQLSGASGDFLRTSDSWANQTRILKLQIESFMATIGQGLINLLTPVIKLLNKLLTVMQNVAAEFKSWTDTLVGTSGSASESITDASNSMGNLASSTEDANAAAKSMKKNLSGLDEIKTYDSGKASDSSSVLGAVTAITPTINTAGASGATAAVEGLADRILAAFRTLQIALQPITTDISSMFNRIASSTVAWTQGLDFTPLATSFNALYTSLLPLVTILTDALAWAWESILLPLATWTINEAAPPLLNALSEAFGAVSSFLSPVIDGVKDLIEWLTPFIDWVGDTAIDIIDWLGEKFNNIGDIFDEKGEKIQEIFSGIGEIFAIVWEAVEPILNDFKEVSKVVFDFFAEHVEDKINYGIDIIHGIVGFIKNVFKGDWDAAWEGIKEALQGFEDFFVSVKENVEDTFNKLVEAIKPLINSIIKFINGLAGGVVDGLNTVFESLNKVQISMPDWMGGESIGFNIKKIHFKEIPQLATGAVIPPNAPFYAMLGDQKHGRNLEMPEDLLRKIVREETAKNNQGGNTYNITATARGRALFELIIAEGRGELVRTGKNPFDLVTT